MATTCDGCGQVAAGDAPPLTWALTIDGGRARRYCEPCTRDHVRSLEAKLSPEHW